MSDRISTKSSVHFGKPCVRGTRATVQSVLELIRDGISAGRICKKFSTDLSTEGVRAASALAPMEC